MAKAVVFFAEGTEECEALLVVDLLRRAKVEVLVASASGSREILSSHKVHITADALAEEVDYSDVDLVVLPGGIPGTPNLAANKTVTDTCAAFAKAGKKVAAICAAPSVLGENGLLRRIIRDFNYRGYSAQETISRWPSVRAGEDKWIFPYQENADVMFNSALLFEFAVLRCHAEPILTSVPRNCPEYAEAYRLLKFIKYFTPVQDKEIPPTSLLREFLGGSSFKY